MDTVRQARELEEMLGLVIHAALQGYGPPELHRDIAGTVKVDSLRKLVRIIYDAGFQDGERAGVAARAARGASAALE